jgi:septal ring factor EnvC (AmiA/AmiB activator)
MRRRGVAICAAIAALAAGAAPAQAPGFDDSRTALVSAKQAAAEAEARAAALSQAAEQASSEAERARARAEALALQVKAAEADIAAAQARISLIASLQTIERSRIAARQGPILHLVAALQTMTRRPSALAIAQPGSLDDMVHVRLLLADTLPVIQARTASLRADLDRQGQLRADAEHAVTALGASHALLAERRQALAVVEATALRRSQRLADQAADEQQRAIGLGEQARDIADRMQTLAEAGDVRARLSALPGPSLRPGGPDDGLPGRNGAVRYRLPVTGDVATGFGEVSSAGVRARGLTVAATEDARVVAPAPGTVIFAGPFRSYARIVIVSHGGGWTTTITGLDALSVKAGQHVGQGDTLGHVGGEAPRVTAELRRDNRPIDILAMAQGG